MASKQQWLQTTKQQWLNGFKQQNDVSDHEA
jgi:hypothetical protein